MDANGRSVADPADKRLYERLGDLRTAGVIDEVDVNRWETSLYLDEDGRIRPGTDPAHAAVLGSRRWAEREGDDLEPAFRTYPSTDIVDTGAVDATGSRRVVRLPLVCTAIYDGETLRRVAPRSTDERVCSVPTRSGRSNATVGYRRHNGGLGTCDTVYQGSLVVRFARTKV